MKTAITRRIGYAVMWGLLAHIPLFSYAQTNQLPITVKLHLAEEQPLILGPENELDQEALSLRQQALSLRKEAMGLRQEAIYFRQEPFTPSQEQGLRLKLETLSGNLEALSLRQESLSFGQHLLMANKSTNPPSGPIPESTGVDLLAASFPTNITSGGFGGGMGSNSCCPSYCGFITFYNSPVGYTCIAGNTNTIRLSLNASMNPLINTSQYCARWRYGGQPTQTGCFSILSSIEQQFVSPVTAQYTFTVYIKTNCPPSGTLYYLTAVTPPPI